MVEVSLLLILLSKRIFLIKLIVSFKGTEVNKLDTSNDKIEVLLFSTLFLIESIRWEEFLTLCLGLKLVRLRNKLFMNTADLETGLFVKETTGLIGISNLWIFGNP